MTTYYLGHTQAGAILARSSTRKDFTHAAVTQAHPAGTVIRASQSTWSTSAAGAQRNAANNWRLEPGAVEVVEVRQVTGTEYRQAIKPA